jgi:cytochrome c oxidase subunit 3
MPAPTLEDRPLAPVAARPGGPGGFGDLNARGGGGEPEGIFGDTARFGLWAFLGTVSMLFIGFTSAYIVRRSGADWQPLPAPLLLWVNTVALLASSVSLERARRLLRAWDLPGARSWLGATGVLGGLFVAGQWLAWKQLAAQGVYLASNPHSSFFYLLTGLHAVHLAGGLVWFAVLFSRLSRLRMTPGRDGLRLFATYWHFLAVLWIYLLFLLFVA